MTPDVYQILKDTCTRACHERHACADGYRQMLASENVSQMMATWRANWEDVTESKYADIIRAELPKQYPALRKEMNKAGIYLNECPDFARKFVRVIVTDTDAPVQIYGEAQAYVLGNAKVIAFNHSQVYNNNQPDAYVVLFDHSYGKVMAGRVSAYDNSQLQCCCHAEVYNKVVCDAYGGTVRALSFRKINAYSDSVIYGELDKGIHLYGKAQFKNLNEYE